MLMNGHFRHKWFDEEISSNMDSYMKLPLLKRLFVLKEYYGILSQPEFSSICNIEPYKTLYKNILFYYKDVAIKEIDEYLKTIEGYEILKYKDISLHRLNILKYTQGKDHIIQSKQLYLDLYEKLLDEGLQICAANVLMIFIQECESPYNIILNHPTFHEPMYYSDFIDQNPLPPPVIDLSDGIHLLYQQYCLPTEISAKCLHISEICSRLDGLIELYDNWKSHPIKVEYSVVIAATLMKLDRKNEAKVYWDFYKNSKLARAHFVPWFRKYLEMLEEEFGDASTV